MKNPADCLFCKIIAGDIPATKVFESDSVIGFNDINPQAPVHVLFIPREHVRSAAELHDDQAHLAGELILAARAYAAQIGISDEGFRLVINCNGHGGQTVYHLHLHLLGGEQLALGFGS
ncbi:MAG: histidine triad nucleotide-binding protein [Pseudomonadota bacterium]